MSNVIRKLKKRHPLNDPSKWSSDIRPPFFDVQAYQKRIDDRVGLNREGKSILKVVWAPEAIGIYGVPRYWVSRVKDGETWKYTSVPRWIFESRVEKSQYAPSWEALRLTMSEDDGFRPSEPPEDFFMFRWLCAEHESIDPDLGQPKCCQRAWEPDRNRCWGTYRAPNDYDLACIEKALQAREQETFVNPYEPLSVAELMTIEANSMKQMAEVAAKQHEERIAIGRDFDKRHGYRLRYPGRLDETSTKDRFHDISTSIAKGVQAGKIILTDS